VRNLVEAGFDVSFHDPLIGAGREMMHLSHRVMSPAVRAEPVTAREEIRLEDRLQHQLQRCLDHPVTDRRDAQVTDLAARLGYRAPPHWQWPEGTSFKILTQLREESFHPAHRLDVTGCLPVHTSGACSLVVPHPIPGHQEEPRVGDKIEQIVEPAMRIITSPTVQLGLDISTRIPARIRAGSSSSVFTSEIS
jgi:hypothetical protein